MPVRSADSHKLKKRRLNPAWRMSDEQLRGIAGRALIEGALLSKQVTPEECEQLAALIPAMVDAIRKLPS